jgi:hypothetical protein
MGRFGFGNPTPGQGTIEMVNDGGWCWIDFGVISYNLRIVPDLTTTRPPQHGTVLTGGIIKGERKTVRYAYKPAPGFAGTDNFAVHILSPGGTSETAVTVTVTR